MGTARLIAAIREFANQVLGRGDATITVPSFDGALKPNQKLEEAETPSRMRSAGGFGDRRRQPLPR